MAVGWPARPDCRPLTAQQPGEPRKSYYLKWGWAPEVSFGFPFIFSLRAGGPIRRREGRRGFANVTSHFTREVRNFCEKVVNRLHRTPTLKSVIMHERSMKKSLFLGQILNYRRKVLQKLSLQKSFFANTVKREGFDSSKLRIFTMVWEKSWFGAILYPFFSTKIREFWNYNIARNANLGLRPHIYSKFIAESSGTRPLRCRAGFGPEIGRNVIFLPVPWLVSAAVV